MSDIASPDIAAPDIASIAAASPEPAAEADDPAHRPQVRLAAGGHRRAETGHPWIFSNEVAMDAAAKALPAGGPGGLRPGGGDPPPGAPFHPPPPFGPPGPPPRAGGAGRGPLFFRPA